MSLQWFKMTVILQGFVTLVVHWCNPLRTIRSAFRVRFVSLAVWQIIELGNGRKQAQFPEVQVLNRHPVTPCNFKLIYGTT